MRPHVSYVRPQYKGVKVFVRGLRAPHRVIPALLLVMSVAAVGSIGASAGAVNSHKSGSYTLADDESLTGPFGTQGIPVSDGIQAAVAVANAHGGVNGHKVKLIVRDDQSSAATAVTNFNEFASDNVSAVVGVTASTASSAMAPLANSDHIPLLSTDLATTLLSPPQPYIFTSDANYANYAAAQVGIVKQLAAAGKLPKTPRIAILSFSTPAGQSWAASVLPAAAKDGFPVVAQLATLPSSTNYGPQAASIASSKPNVILDIVNEAALAALVPAMQSAGVSNSTLLVGFISDTQLSFMKALGWPDFISMSPDNFPQSSHAAVLNSPRNEAKTFNVDPNQTLYLQGYAAGLIALNALARCGYPCNGQKMKKAIQTTNLNTKGLSTSNLIINTTNHAAVHSVTFLGVDPLSGKLEVVGKPISFVGL